MTGRISVDGKHLVADGAPWRIRGVTYGTFAPRADGLPFPDRDQIKRDLDSIGSAGLNTVRTYTLPPPELLELAGEMGLRVLVGLHYRDWHLELPPGRRARRRVLDAGLRAVEQAMELCAERCEVLAISVGNEVPGPLVRAHGIGAVQETLSALVEQVHEADPGMLATYSNFPTTEYLEIDDLDLVCFNVFLEQPGSMTSYLRHLMVVSRDRPLVLTELGLASDLHRLDGQARSLAWQLELVDTAGGAGATVFAWTDDWAVGGRRIEGWGFGLTDIDRNPRPALATVGRWATTPLSKLRARWPSITVVVCAHDEERVIGGCLDSLQRCEYPDLDVVVCADGCTDRTADVARSLGAMLVELPHVGLAAARNAGARAAAGEIVAFLDADAQCHPQWPYHLALALEDDDVGAVGGPNLPFAEATLVERAVALSPGAPAEVLTADDRAEHVPGCNLAVRRDVLEEVGGFDPLFDAAGDDVDLCWRVLDGGLEIAFAPAAQVHHHRRSTIKGYLRQQYGYGRAERLVAARHPHRFNQLGQARWRGLVYGGLRVLPALLRPVVYHGAWGAAPFQPAVRHPSAAVAMWAGALVVPVTAAGMVGALISPLARVGLGAAIICVLLIAAYGAAIACAVHPERGEQRRMALRLLVAFLHVTGPLVRAYGRLRGRSKLAAREAPPWTGDRLGWLEQLEQDLLATRGCAVTRGAPHDAWDLRVRVGPLLSLYLTTAVASGWTPVWRGHYRPRAQALVVCALVLGAAVPLGVTAGALAVAVALAAAGEAIVLRRRVARSLCWSTLDARLGGPPRDLRR